MQSPKPSPNAYAAANELMEELPQSDPQQHDRVAAIIDSHFRVLKRAAKKLADQIENFPPCCSRETAVRDNCGLCKDLYVTIDALRVALKKAGE